MPTETEVVMDTLGRFIGLQVISAMPTRILKSVGARERVIYFIFIESAAFVCLTGLVPEAEIESFVLDQIFGPEGLHEDLGVTINDKKMAYGLLGQKDADAIKISQESDRALQSFVSGKGSATQNVLSSLISDNSLLQGIS